MIIDRLRKLMLQYGHEWDTNLPASVLVINTRTSSRLRISPLEALIGRRQVTPLVSLSFRANVDKLAQLYEELEINPATDHRLEILKTIREEAARITDEVNRTMMTRYNQKIHPREYEVGDVVLMKPREVKGAGRKFLPRWIGPGVITWIGSRGAAGVLDRRGATKTYNLDDLKPYYHL